MDWKKCVVCQKDTKETLQCPANSKRTDIGAGYRSFVTNLKAFQELGTIPEILTLTSLDEGQGIEQTLVDNKAVWHIQCKDRFSNTKLKRAIKRKSSEIDNEDIIDNDTDEVSFSPIKARRSLSERPQELEVRCFFCEEQGSDLNSLQAVTMMRVDSKVRQCALLLQDGKLIAKLSAGDLIAIEAKYHTKCLVSLYNRARAVLKSTSENSQSQLDKGTTLEELAFSELLGYIDDFIQREEVVVLKLSDLAAIYETKQRELGIETSVNKTRLKEKILDFFPDLSAHYEGRQVLFALKQDIGGTLLRGANSYNDSDRYHLAKAANIIRRDLNIIKNSFDGTFKENCQAEAIPASLKTLLKMIMKGPTSTKMDDSQACLTIAQLIQFNSLARVREREPTSTTRHPRSRECPLPIYAALKIYGATRDKSLIDTFYNLGLSISYDRLLAITTEVTNTVIARYEKDGVVCPANLRDGIFTTTAVDNLDHNTSSTSAHGSFHGTAISITQHPTKGETGSERPVDTIETTSSNSSKTVSKLPSFYTDVEPVIEPPKNYFAAKASDKLVYTNEEETGEVAESDWLESVANLSFQDEIKNPESVSWAAYRASKAPIPSHLPAVISLLPMFTENAHTVAMIRHSMKVVKSATSHINPNQIPVMALDQPLFALAKQIQWTGDGEFCEDNFVCMMGGLHIEMDALKILGKWLTGSGWSEMICDSEVASQGVADSFLTAKHITRTRRAHQITAASLNVLMGESYDGYQSNNASTNPKRFEEWKKERENDNPQFLYWSRVLDIEMICLKLVRSFREGDFNLYIQAIKSLLPWVFALDNQNYARWLSVHLRDMLDLPNKHPAIHREFMKGSFVVHKTQKVFSSIPLDHAHEQVNALVKGEGGAVGLTENPAALRRWMVAGPEVSRMVKEFEEVKETKKDLRHHEQTPAVQSAFMKDVKRLVSEFRENGNPFSEVGGDLVAIHTKDVMDPSIVKTVQDVVKMGKKQFETFAKERFTDRSKPITEPLKKNKLPIPSTQTKKVVTADKAKMKELKQDCALFSRLYIACQSRDGNLDDFFTYENQPWPPSIAQNGKLRGGKKADLVKCLTTDVPEISQRPPIDVMILDGAVIVQMLPVKTSRTFDEYFTTVFSTYLLKQLERAKRIDLVWDEYRGDSLKSSTREKRGSGQRRKVLPNAPIPSDWKGFLRVDKNKEELFKFLSNSCYSHNLLL